MLMRAGRRGLLGLALGSSLLWGGAPCATAEEPVESTAPPDLKTAAAPSTDAQKFESKTVVAPPAGPVAPLPTRQAASDSHRRRTVEPPVRAKSSRRSHGLSITEAPIDRLRQGATSDVNILAAPTERATLAEVMRRLAGWTDSCPLCGNSCPLCGQADQYPDLPDAVVPPKPSADRQVLGHVGREEPGDERFRQPLQAGEPAQVILDTQKRLGKSVLDGTEFGGSPELLIQWIRALDEESRRQQAMLEEVSRADVEEAEQEVLAVTEQSQIEALRKACHELQEAADLLEEQNLFESADSVRGIADALRRQSRRKVGDLGARRTSVRLTERVDECGVDECEGKCEGKDE